MGYTRISNLHYNISAVCISVPDLSESDDIVTRIKQELIDKTLRIEKLSHSSLKLYAIELGGAKRVIVTIENTLQYGTVINIREVLHNHEYERSSILSPQNTQHLAKLDELDEELSSTTTTTTTTTSTSSTNDNTIIKTISKKSYHKILPFDQDNPIIYDVDQTEIIDSILNIQNSCNSHGRTLLTHGFAGSGKTIVMLEAISQLPSGKYVIMVKSSKLLEDIKKQYDDVYKNLNSDVEVQFESLGSDVSFSDFQHWYNGFYQVNKNQYKLKDQNAAQVYSAMQELALGKKSDNKQIKTIYEGYIQYLSQEEKVDSALKPDSNLCKGKFDDVQGVFIDEVYDFGQVELQNITRHIPQHVNLYCFGDMHQSLGGDYGGYIQSSMKKALYKQDRPEATEYDLIGSYRNSVPIKKLVANILDQARLVNQDHKDISDTILCDKNQIDIQPRTSGYHFTNTDSKKTIDNVHKSIQNGSNIAIIVDNKKSKAGAQKQFNLSSKEAPHYIYTVEESKGLEFDSVVLFNYFTDNKKDMDEFFKPSKHNKTLSNNYSLSFSVSKLYVAIARAKTALTIIEDKKYFRSFQESYTPVISRGITDNGTVDVLAFDVDSTVNLIRQLIDRSDFDKAKYRLDKLTQYIERYTEDENNHKKIVGLEDIQVIQAQYNSLMSLLEQKKEQVQEAKCQEKQHTAVSGHVQQNLAKGSTPTEKTKTPSKEAPHNTASSKTHGGNQVNKDIAKQCEHFIQKCLDMQKKINLKKNASKELQERCNFQHCYDESVQNIITLLASFTRDDFFKWKDKDGRSIIDVLVTTHVIETLKFKDLKNNHAFVRHLAVYMAVHKDNDYIKSLHNNLDVEFIDKITLSQSMLEGIGAIDPIDVIDAKAELKSKSKQKKMTPEKFVDEIKRFQKFISKDDQPLTREGLVSKQRQFIKQMTECFNLFEEQDFQKKMDNAGIIAHIIHSCKTEIIVSASNFPDTAINQILYFMAFDNIQALVGIFDNECFSDALSQKHLLKGYKGLDKILTKLLSLEWVYLYLDKIIDKLDFNDKKVKSIFEEGGDIYGDNTFASKCVIKALQWSNLAPLTKLITLIKPRDHYKILMEYIKLYSDFADNDVANLVKLIECGVNINAVDSDGNNILHYLAKNKELHVSDNSLKNLLRAGLKFDAQNKECMTPLFIASQHKNKKLLELFTKCELTKTEIVKDPCIWAYIHYLSVSITTEANQVLLKTLFDNNPSEVSHLMLDKTEFSTTIFSVLVKNNYFNDDNSIKINDIVSHLKQGDLFTLSDYVKGPAGTEYEYLHQLLPNFDELCAISNNDNKDTDLVGEY